MVESSLVSFSVFYTCLKLCESSLFTVWQNREINESTVLYYPTDGAVKKNDGFSSLLIQKQIILTLSELDGHQIYWEMVLLMSSIVQQVSSTQPWRSWLMLISYPENSKFWIQGCWRDCCLVGDSLRHSWNFAACPGYVAVGHICSTKIKICIQILNGLFNLMWAKSDSIQYNH